MSNKTFVIVLILCVLAAGSFTVVNKNKQPKKLMLGVQHSNQGQEHIIRGQKHVAYNSDPASSGPHYSDQGAPAPWGAYPRELPEEVFIHNEEHGGVVITYNPKMLSADQISSLQKLFTTPYSDTSFSPTKAIVMPRTQDSHAIEIASWTYTYNLDSYNADSLKGFYLQHVGQSPERTAGPTNQPRIY
jgi:hypothetical protein